MIPINNNNIISLVITAFLLLMSQNCFSQQDSAKKALHDANPALQVNALKFDSSQSAKVVLGPQLNSNSNQQKQGNSLQSNSTDTQSAKAMLASKEVSQEENAILTRQKPVPKRKRHPGLAADSTNY